MGDRPRVLLVVTLAETGGAQAYVRDLVPGLVGEFDVTVAAHGPGPLADAVRERGAAFVPLRHVRRAISPRDVLGLFELWRLCRRLRPRIVHANSSKAGILGRIAGWAARVDVRLFTAHGWAFKATTGAAATLYLWADRLVRPLATTVICVSRTEETAGLAAGVCSPGRTVTIYNGVELGAPPAPRRPGTPVRIVSVGRLAEPKDFGTLLAAIARPALGTVELELLGDGPQRAALEAMARRLGIADLTHFLGEVGDVPDRLRRADVFVLSSRSEGLPISVLEAMAAGLPIVATAVGGLGELVDDGVTGLLVPAGDVNALAEALATLAADPARCQTLGAASRRRAEERFSIAACRQAHVELYRRLLAERSAG
ncbi:MAG: glycosyltransferase family 4 protein [Gaiellales bacterium]